MSELDPTTGEQVDVTALTESELIDIIADLPRSISPLGEAAMEEYDRRRSEVIGRAMAERALERETKE